MAVADTDPFRLSSPRIFLVRMVVFLILVGFIGLILYKKIGTAFMANPGLNGLIFGVLFVGIVSLVICAVIGPAPGAVFRSASVLYIVGVLYLGIIGSVAFSAYTYLVAVEPAEKVVSYALVNPLIALVLGLGFAAESPTPYLALGVLLALVGLAFMLYGERLAAWLRSKARGAR